MTELTGLYDLYKNCTLCPRRCGVDRTGGEVGTCLQGDKIKLATAVVHFGEEPPLVAAAGRNHSGTAELSKFPGEATASSAGTYLFPSVDFPVGSGTVFFSGCTMRCGFCQNRQLSRNEVGRVVDTDTFVDIVLKLEQAGALNINLVSGTPFIPGILAGLEKARGRGLSLPVVWNSSGYETEEAVDLLSSYVDIFLPDIKILDSGLASRLFAARDYPDYARAAVARMISKVPLRFVGGREIQKASCSVREARGERARGKEGEAARKTVLPEGTLLSGTIVRHLLLPGILDKTEEVLRWCAAEGIGTSSLLSLMLQFGVPKELKGWRRGVKEVENRPLSAGEYSYLLELLDELGIEEGFIQEPRRQEEMELWWPDFRRRNPFPPGQAVAVWSWNR